jgi:hypothetical protein
MTVSLFLQARKEKQIKSSIKSKTFLQRLIAQQKRIRTQKRNLKTRCAALIIFAVFCNQPGQLPRASDLLRSCDSVSVTGGRQAIKIAALLNGNISLSHTEKPY